MKNPLSSFFLLLLSATGVVTLTYLNTSGTGNAVSYASEGGVKQLNLREGQNALVYCSGGVLSHPADLPEGTYLCGGNMTDSANPDVRPEDGMRYEFLKVGQKVAIDCPNIRTTLSYPNGKYIVYCLKGNDRPPTITPSTTPSPTPAL